MPRQEEYCDHRAANTTGSTGYKDNAGRGFGHGFLQMCCFFTQLFGETSIDKFVQLFLYTFSTKLAVRDAAEHYPYCCRLFPSIVMTAPKIDVTASVLKAVAKRSNPQRVLAACASMSIF